MSRFEVLLLQARHASDPARDEERRSFARHSGLDPEQVVPYDLLSGTPSLNEITRRDALMIGGSGEYYVSRNHLPGQQALFGVLREVAEVGHPTFASCFGFHLMVEALGGEIIHDPHNVEVGTHDVELTSAAAEDPLLSILPSRFAAQMGRKDRAARLPEGALNLARTEVCPLQAFRVSDRLVWATQFHPELDEETNRARYLNYLEGYAELMDEAERARARRLPAEPRYGGASDAVREPRARDRSEPLRGAEEEQRTMSTADWIGSAGVGILLVAFVLNLAGTLPRGSRLYHGLNLIGAGTACYASVLIDFVPFVVLEGVWALAALGALVFGAKTR